LRRSEHGSRPWRRKKEKIEGQQEGRKEVEREVCREGEKRCPVGHYESRISETECPVEDANENFERGGRGGEAIFYGEETAGRRQVGEETKDKACRCNCEAYRVRE